MKFDKEHIAQIICNIKKEEHLVYLLNEVKKTSEELSDVDSFFSNKQLKFFLSALNQDLDTAKDLTRSVYYEFKIPKKNGEFRVIHAPNESLKSLLKCIDILIREFYTPHHRAYGFVNDKSIVDNAKIHVGKNYVYNIDLKDFFHSFDIQQVKWVFYNQLLAPIADSKLKEKLAYTLASLVTCRLNDKRILPQGSPCSPSITNMLCLRLDRKLYRLAKKNGGEFSRYADDISFSCDRNIFNGAFISELHEIINSEKLEINPSKTRLQRANERQEVTGLTVNQDVNVTRKYIKEIRQSLYLCERYGTEKAQTILKSNTFQNVQNVEEQKLPNIELYLKGKLNYLSMVKGKNHTTYLKLEERFNNLFPKKTTLVQQVIHVWKELGIRKASDTFNKLKKSSLDNILYLSGNRSNDLAISAEFSKFFDFYNSLGRGQKTTNNELTTLREHSVFLKIAKENPELHELIQTAQSLNDSDEKIDEFLELLLRSHKRYVSQEWIDYYLIWRKDPSSFSMMINSDFEASIDDYHQTFIADLLNYPKISKTERVAIIELWGKEVGIKKNNEEKYTSPTTKRHNPKEMISFLYQFSTDEQYKWFTHPDSNIDRVDYLSKLESFKHIKIPFNLNYATVKFIKSFFIQDNDSNNKLNIEYPPFKTDLTYFNEKIKNEIRKGTNPFDIVIDNHYFVDVINKFKYAIEFRADSGKYKFNELFRDFISNKISIDFNEQYTPNFKKYANYLSAYIDVNNFFRGLNIIIAEWINKYKSLSNELVIDLDEENDYFLLSLFHKGSEIIHEPNSIKVNGLAGNLNTLRKYWFSVVDFEIHADFTEKKVPQKLICLDEQTEMTGTKLNKCKVEPHDENIGGVKYMIKLYKNTN